ncbi:craniofacial development protein 2-like [Neoarius graeffei]|uniref:craniofacial development protein 2-like n=1 Tax=Neoarius graeffei TaxID=443677 RepID=UPI00298CE217|nr:craniofacial development protein 2-like [Neoarius graeffei]
MGWQYLITSSAWRNTAQASVGGVGIVLSPDARKVILNIKSVSSRILLANLRSNPVTMVIPAYSPTRAAMEEDIESFYSDLHGTISDVPAHNFLLILGDFNGHLGNNKVPFSYHEESNRNEEYLLELMEDHALIACNTQFQKAPKKLWTWISPPNTNGVRHRQQIDFILTRRKWRNSILDCQAYNSLASISSDHRALLVKVRLSLKAQKKNAPRGVSNQKQIPASFG